MKASVRAINKRGFVFVVTEDGDRIFVHATACDFPIDLLGMNEAVDIEDITNTPKGLAAHRCKRVL